jgi:multicomponent K+:H+ antiporter subunit F
MGCCLVRLLKGPMRRTACWRWTACTSTACCHAGAGHHLQLQLLRGGLLMALFGCVSSTAMAKFLLRGEVIE